LQKKVKHIDAEIERLKQQKDSLEKNLTDQTGAGKAIKDILDAYAKALPGLIKELRDDETYADTKMRMILCAIEEYKSQIDQKIAEYDRKIAEKTAAVEQLKAQKADAEQQLAQAQADEKAKQDKLDNWKKLQATIEANLAEIASLKTQIEKEDDLSHPAKMYFLTLELQKVLRNTKIVSVDELKAKLYNGWEELNQAKEVTRQKKSALDAITAKLDQAQAELDEWKTKRREKILEKLSVFDQRDPQKQYQAAAGK
jgi:chromosome segregation ATPase